MTRFSLAFAFWVLFAQTSAAGQCPPDDEGKTIPSLTVDQGTLHRVRQAEQHYRQALTFLTENKDLQAEEEFRNALLLRPANEQYVRSLTNFYIERKRYDDAIQVIKNHVDVCGATALGYELQGELLFQKKLFGPAFESLQASLARSPKSARAHQLVGLMYMLGRNYPKALEELQISAEQNPSNPQIRYFLGRVLYTTGRYLDAKKEFLKCLELQAGYPKALENLGLTYEGLQEFPSAEDAYRQAIALEEARPGQKFVEPHVYYGVLLHKLGRQEGVSYLRKAVALSPRSFRANYELGRVLLSFDQLKEAETFLLKAADLYPQFSRTYFLLGRISRSLERKEEAQRYWSRFEELDKEPENREFPLTDR